MTFKDAVVEFVSELTSARLGPYQISESLRRSMDEVNVSLSELLEDNDYLRVKSSVGAGNWANVAWICVLDQRVTTTTQSGFYVSMLFSRDLANLYVGLGLGVSDLYHCFEQNDHCL